MHPCPGEDHGAIGDIESLIGKVKTDARAFLRSEDCDVMSGLLHVITAHNALDRVGGFSPSQWAYGRMETREGRLFEGGHDDPVLCSQGVPSTTMRKFEPESESRRVVPSDTGGSTNLKGYECKT